MTLSTVISYPISVYQNPPINPQYYQPSQFFISAVTLGQTTTITTTVNNNYVIGQLVRLIIPSYSGCRELDQKTAYVISLPSANQVTLAIDSSVNVSPFISTTYNTQPQIMAIGNINLGATNGSGGQILSTSIPGSFVDISPA